MVLDILSALRVPRAPQVFVGPRVLMATRVPPLAIEQWQLYRYRPPEKGG